jgi:hypothetical protein
MASYLPVLPTFSPITFNSYAITNGIESCSFTIKIATSFAATFKIDKTISKNVLVPLP